MIMTFRMVQGIDYYAKLKLSAIPYSAINYHLHDKTPARFSKFALIYEHH